MLPRPSKLAASWRHLAAAVLMVGGALLAVSALANVLSTLASRH